ncbi:MAG: hypothetical protein HQM03_21795 [Magnetococcales bacterium]|nr:hypothetical protein [Magnetococcales bacterium]
MADKWTPKMVAARLEEAASTLRRLKVSGLKPKGYGSSWPDVIHDSMEAYGWNRAVVSLGPPPADAISRMDETIAWLRWLEPDHVRLLWLRAERMPWKLVMSRLGVARSTASSWWMASIMQIVAILNVQQKMSGHLSAGHFGQNVT